jgi:plastocyanin
MLRLRKNYVVFGRSSLPRYLLALLCMVAILGASRMATYPAQAQDQPTLTIGDNFFEPTEWTVLTGGTVSWVNNGLEAHTVTSADDLFDVVDLRPGDTFSYTFASPGDFSYFCRYHAGQIGVIHVVAEEIPVMVGEALTLEPISTAPSTPTLDPIATATAAPPTPTLAPPTAEFTATPQPTATTTPTVTVTPTAFTPTATRAPGLTNAEIGMMNQSFSPYSITVLEGATITFTNRDRIAHRAVGSGFDTGILTAGQSKTIRVSRSGGISYRCSIHGAPMVGHIDVLDT